MATRTGLVRNWLCRGDRLIRPMGPRYRCLYDVYDKIVGNTLEDDGKEVDVLANSYAIRTRAYPNRPLSEGHILPLPTALAYPAHSHSGFFRIFLIARSLDNSFNA